LQPVKNGFCHAERSEAPDSSNKNDRLHNSSIQPFFVLLNEKLSPYTLRLVALSKEEPLITALIG
jgi:hypothetical protein